MNNQQDRTRHEVLRQIPYGLYVVGVRGEDGRSNALVVSWMMQCSFEPPLIAVALRKDSLSCELLRQGHAFSVNLIDRNDSAIVRELVKPARHSGDKLDGVAHMTERTGAPVIEEALAYLECKVRSEHDAGDHVLFVGEVVGAGSQREGDVLVCADLGWHYAG